MILVLRSLSTWKISIDFNRPSVRPKQSGHLRLAGLLSSWSVALYRDFP
jgi:hypothetical protein